MVLNFYSRVSGIREKIEDKLDEMKKERQQKKLSLSKQLDEGRVSEDEKSPDEEKSDKGWIHNILYLPLGFVYKNGENELQLKQRPVEKCINCT